LRAVRCRGHDDARTVVELVDLEKDTCSDSVFKEDVGTDDVYKKTARSFVQAAVGAKSTEPVSVMIIADGATNSGKTHTMQGTDLKEGFIQMIAKDICDGEGEVDITVVEIYLEESFDLIAKTKISLGKTFKKVKLVSKKVLSVDDLVKTCKRACSRRRIAETAYNSVSSRSHTRTVFTTVNGSRIILIDLAGAESAPLARAKDPPPRPENLKAAHEKLKKASRLEKQRIDINTRYVRNIVLPIATCTRIHVSNFAQLPLLNVTLKSR
jgi:hypothetical protein